MGLGIDAHMTRGICGCGGDSGIGEQTSSEETRHNGTNGGGVLWSKIGFV